MSSEHLEPQTAVSWPGHPFCLKFLWLNCHFCIQRWHSLQVCWRVAWHSSPTQSPQHSFSSPHSASTDSAVLSWTLAAPREQEAGGRPLHPQNLVTTSTKLTLLTWSKKKHLFFWIVWKLLF
jgi:hypothetical protein